MSSKEYSRAKELVEKTEARMLKSPTVKAINQYADAIEKYNSLRQNKYDNPLPPYKSREVAGGSL